MPLLLRNPPVAGLAAQAFLLLSYLALSAVPFVPLLLGKPADAPWQTLGMEVVAWTAVWAVFKRPAWFHWLLLPAFLALPTELYLFVFYGQGISTHHLGIIAETSPKESLEFLGQKVWLMLAVMVAVVAWWALGWRAARRNRDLDWDDGSRWVALAALAGAAAVWAYGHEFGIHAKAAAPASASASAAATQAAAKPSTASATDHNNAVPKTELIAVAASESIPPSSARAISV